MCAPRYILENSWASLLPAKSTHALRTLETPFPLKSLSMRGIWFSSSISSTITTVQNTIKNDQNTPPSEKKTIRIPIDASPSENRIPVPVQLPPSLQSVAATRIQSAYRSHRIRALIRLISAVDSEVSRYELLIRRQDTVDAVRRDGRERLRLNECLMSLLLRLDSVPGIDPSVRELRRRTSHRIVALQEVLDAVAEERVDDWARFPPSWDEIVSGIRGEWDGDGGEDDSESLCRERMECWFGGWKCKYGVN
ncbi:BAG family molecular chaperone regulator 5, mitochondrial-like [Magnolia sinica]|uniref:BAG family molecular chaperone regulator 5, mitochondrial-like n=1 Tax=Magnolia sinica TaxID=86752 RepID=UPI0026590FCD|nr:BAG family molecular chaperone regulator 5, mitochondrial-like [Magnolia sinica]